MEVSKRVFKNYTTQSTGMRYLNKKI